MNVFKYCQSDILIVKLLNIAMVASQLCLGHALPSTAVFVPSICGPR